MSAPKFIIAALFAITIALASPAGAGYTLANDADNIAYPALPPKVEVATDDSTQVEPELVETSSLDDARLSQQALTNQSQIIKPSDPYVDKQWALDKINAFQLWQMAPVTEAVVVAILDTGIDPDHQDLNGLIMAEANFTDSSSPADSYGHGTHVAGIIAANINNGVGIAGVAPESRLLNVKVADDKGRCSASVVAQAVIWAVDNGASVINISLELREPSSELENAVNYAWNKGAVIVAAAGNDASQIPVYPAYYKNSIAVAATKQDDNLAPLSNHGDWVDVAAPGVNIYSILPGNSYGYETGTSFAAGYVSGLAALLFSIVTDTNGDGMVNDEVRATIETGCMEIGLVDVGHGK